MTLVLLSLVSLLLLLLVLLLLLLCCSSTRFAAAVVVAAAAGQGVSDARGWGETEESSGEIRELESRGAFVMTQPSVFCCLFLAERPHEETAVQTERRDAQQGDDSSVVVLQVWLSPFAVSCV